MRPYMAGSDDLEVRPYELIFGGTLLLFFIGIYSAVISCTYFLLPLYLQGTLNFSGGQIGLLYAVLNLNAILVAFPVGVSGDRYPARVLTRLGLAGTALCLWGMAGHGPLLALSGGLLGLRPEPVALPPVSGHLVV